MSTKFFFAFCFLFGELIWGFEIDLSRRQTDLHKLPVKAHMGKRSPASAKADVKKVMAATASSQDIVILNTERGFVPSIVNLRIGHRYRVHVVNINKTKKNVSFIMPAYNEQHSTYYGEMKVFDIEPKQEGVFSYESPETAVEGRLVVISGVTRDMASELDSNE